MNWLKKLFGTSNNDSAQLAKERLQVIVAHARSNKKAPDFLPKLQKEIMDVIAKYVSVDQDQVSVSCEQNKNGTVLELNMTLPDEAKPAANEPKKPKKRKKKAS